MLEGLDAVVLARVQFAFTIAFHIVFPAFSIGLASYLAVLEGLWLATGRSVYLDLFRYWLKIFAVAFGMGVVSGVVMSYQFGTNWSVFSDKTGPVLGPLMAYEVLTAFFLEAGFLGVMLFGMGRVGKGLHYFATLMVAVGTLFSALTRSQLIAYFLTVVVLLVVTLVGELAPVASQAASGSSETVTAIVEAGTSVAASYINIVYLPAKLVVAFVGGIAGGVAGFLSGGDQRAAYALWVPLMGGDYFVRPENLSGERPLAFFGSDYADQPSTWNSGGSTYAYDALYN